VSDHTWLPSHSNALVAGRQSSAGTRRRKTWTTTPIPITLLGAAIAVLILDARDTSTFQERTVFIRVHLPTPGPPCQMTPRNSVPMTECASTKGASNVRNNQKLPFDDATASLGLAALWALSTTSFPPSAPGITVPARAGQFHLGSADAYLTHLIVRASTLGLLMYDGASILARRHLHPLPSSRVRQHHGSPGPNAVVTEGKPVTIT